MIILLSHTKHKQSCYQRKKKA